MNYALASQDLLGIFLTFCRSAGIFFLIAPFSDKAVNNSLKFLIALSLSFLFYREEIGRLVEPLIREPIALGLTVAIELFTGFALALFIKILLSTTQVAGMTIAAQMGLNSGSLFDPTQGTHNSTIGFLLSFLTTVLMLETGLAAKILFSLYSSYDTIGLGVIEDFNKIIISAVSKMWNLGIQLSLPFLLINLVMMVGAGILAKIMPQLQIFFFILPLQIIVGILLLIASLSGLLFYFLDFLQEEIFKIL
jgi:flagellar biosynthetic protein FliR